MIRLTARGRLTILYTGLMFTVGLVLVTLTYLLVARSMRSRWVVMNSDQAQPPVPTEADPESLPPVAERLREDTLNQLLIHSAIALAVVTVLSAALGWLIANRILRPIRVISTTAQRLSATNLNERVPVNPPADELSALAGIVNDMLDRIQLGIAERDGLLDSQRMFVANAAHELRTPLTTMRTAIDVTLDGSPGKAELTAMAVDIRDAIGHAQRTLDGLLMMARSQTGTAEPCPVDLADLAAEVLGNVTAGAGVEVRRELQPALAIGEPILLERMIINLVDNGIRHNHPGGNVTVTTRTEAEWAVLHVGNTGPRVAGEAYRLLEPFVRGDRDRTGTSEGAGLGLSIVRAVVVAHRGHITMTPRPAGGLDIAVAVPLDPGAAAGASNPGAGVSQISFWEHGTHGLVHGKPRGGDPSPAAH